MFDDLDVYAGYLEELVGFQRDYRENSWLPIGGFEVVNGDIESSLIVLKQIAALKEENIHNSDNQSTIPPVSERTP